jgi:KipI family sensor histidine kinase inhibitor
MLKQNELSKPIIDIAGEDALIIYFSDKTSNDTSEKIQFTEQLIRQAMKGNMSGEIVDLIPSYASILIVFNILTTDYLKVRKKLKEILSFLNVNSSKNNDVMSSSVIELPVYYSTESGPDLTVIAERNKLSVEQVISIHQSKDYHVYAIGFAPGFAYLGEVDERIASPRLSTPRMKVPKGAVAIADKQTAVYPNNSPGGWNIIGLCPIDMFDAMATPIMPVHVGDKVRFKSISRDEFLALGGELSKELGQIS